MFITLLNFFLAEGDILLIVLPLFGLLIGGALGFFITRAVINNKIGNAKNHAAAIVEDAKTEAKTLKKEAILEAKEENLKLKTDFEDKRKKERRMQARIQNYSERRTFGQKRRIGQQKVRST